jgi:hypothetical protein
MSTNESGFFIFRVEQRRRTPGAAKGIIRGKALAREKQAKQQLDGGVLKVQSQSYAMSS